MKIKMKKKDCHLVIKVKTAFGENIDEKELDKFARFYLRGFLQPHIIKKNQIEYTGPVGIRLCDRLKMPLTKREFLFIMEQLVVAVQKLQKHSLPLHNLLMNIQYAYINTATKEVQLIYLPVMPSSNGNLIEFIESIVYSINPAPEEKDHDFVARFIYFFRMLQPFDICKIENYIEKEDRSVVNTIKKQNAGLSGFMTNKQQHYYEHYGEKRSQGEELTDLLKEENEATGLLDDEATGLLREGSADAPADDEATGLLDDEATGLLSEEGTNAFADNEATGLLDDEATGLLSEEGTNAFADNEATGLLDDEATGLLTDNVNEDTVLLSENQTNIRYPTLERVLTKEIISINKPVFRLGKEKSYVDYFVTNNIAVSRSHADIITRGNRFFVVDLNSKNHTYINGRVLPVHCEIEINNGDSLKLGNEEFIFHI